MYSVNFFEHSAKPWEKMEKDTWSWVRTSSCILHLSVSVLFSPISLCGVVACLCCKRGSYFSEVGKWIFLSTNHSACQLPPDFEELGCLGNVNGCCCGNPVWLTTGFPWAGWGGGDTPHWSLGAGDVRWVCHWHYQESCKKVLIAFAFTYLNFFCWWLLEVKKWGWPIWVID